MGPHGSRAGVMAKDNRGGSNGWMQVLHELLKTDIYKRSQGRIVRQVTFFAIWLAFALAAWRIHVYMHAVLANYLNALLARYMTAVPASLPMGVAYAVPLVILIGGFWISFRIVNLPSFADFLIAVEAEMNKVSWPSQTELVRCSMVVIILMFGLTMVLFAYDNILVFLFRILGIT
jgi:preprotein translocase subunit SecE